jgi:sugar/nucleoside kinase (ribokinase family)
MKIGVIGTFISDQIFHINGTETNSFGGIFYSVSILGNLVSERDEIYPVCYLGEDIYNDIIERLSSYNSVKTSGIKKVAQENTAVRLIYKTTEQRDEYLSHRLPPLHLDHILGIGAMDVWLVNFITGFEMSLATLQQFRQQASGLILMDFHSLSLAIKEDGHRILRKLHGWEQWISGIDVLQMNEAEAASIIDHKNLSEADLIDFGNQVIENDIKIFHITHGSKGSLLFYKENHRKQNQKIPAYQVNEVVDVTGCGDAFSAGFLVHYFRHRDIVEATKHANRVAGFNCTLSGTEELFKLKKFLRNVATDRSLTVTDQ